MALLGHFGPADPLLGHKKERFFGPEGRLNFFNFFDSRKKIANFCDFFRKIERVCNFLPAKIAIFDFFSTFFSKVEKSRIFRPFAWSLRFFAENWLFNKSLNARR